MARAIEADIVYTKLSKDVWCQTFIVLVVIVLHIRQSHVLRVRPGMWTARGTRH